MNDNRIEPNAVRDHFNRISLEYSSHFLSQKTGRNFSFRKRMALATETARNISGRVFDCAIGSGEIIQAIIASGNFDGATLLDLSPQMLELASRQIKGKLSEESAARIEMVCDDVFRFAAENSGRKYSLVVCLGLIAHTGRLPELLRLLRSLLEKDGVILLQSTLLDHPGTRLIRYFGGRHSSRKHGYEISYFWHKDIEAACASAGLKIASCRRFTLGIPFGDRLWPWGNYQLERIFDRWAAAHGSEAIYILKADAAS